MSSAPRGIALAVLLAAACAPTLPTGRARPPNTAVPPSYGGASEWTNSAPLKWSELLTDPKLVALIEEALRNNQELNIASLEVEIAKNEVMAKRGEYLPHINFGVGAGIEKVSTYSSQGKADDANGVAVHLPDFAFGFTASWEIDVWSKLRNAARAASVRYLATEEGRKFTVTTLVAEVASSYYELLSLDAQLDIVQQNIAIQQRALAVVQLQKEAAKVTELAVKRFEAEVLKNQSRQYGIRQRIVETENRINFLVGRFPQHVERNTVSFLELAPPLIHAGIPAQLLDNRPDVKRAQLELIATDLDFKVAKAAFYPSLGISASVGYQAFDFLKIVATPASLVYGLAADVLAPLWNRRALTAAYFSANAKQKQAVFNYERTILTGYIEVTRLLMLAQNLERSYELQQAEVDRLVRSIDISSQLFASARADYMEVLMTRRDALEAQVDLIENKERQLLAAVGLYQALGGGWR